MCIGQEWNVRNLNYCMLIVKLASKDLILFGHLDDGGSTPLYAQRVAEM